MSDESLIGDMLKQTSFEEAFEEETRKALMEFGGEELLAQVREQLREFQSRWTATVPLRNTVEPAKKEQYIRKWNVRLRRDIREGKMNAMQIRACAMMYLHGLTVPLPQNRLE